LAELARHVGPGNVCTRRIVLSGHVQGVGFRPFVYRLAREHGLTGRVRNQLGEVEVVATGPVSVLNKFERDLVDSSPPLAKPGIDLVEEIERTDFPEFEISESAAGTEARIFVPQDFFMCDDCRRELQDPADRRYRYPFINCTQCGPRYTLIEALPMTAQIRAWRTFRCAPNARGNTSTPPTGVSTRNRWLVRRVGRT
jgi:hydrogenase maturation protein HypF